MKTKLCRGKYGCNKEKNLDEFHNLSKSPDGKQYTCKDCQNNYKNEWAKNNKENIKSSKDKWKCKNPDYNREWNFKNKYGISIEEYNKMLDEQDGKCLICDTREPKGSHNTFNVDHCHITGNVRGLLCWSCNSGMGKFNDDIGLLEKVILYLKKYEYVG
jgi:Autographiviridae endonuclease VII